MLLRSLLVSAVAATLVGAAPAAVLRVEQDGSGEYLKIQDAVNVAANGDTILIGPGRYDDLQPRGVNNVVCVAFWDKGGALTFIGESAVDVIIGPETYAPDGTGPQGIHQRAPADIVVRNLTFTNLLSAIVGGDAVMRIEDSRFDTGEVGLFVQDPDTCIVHNCTFTNFPYPQAEAIGIFRAGYVDIAGSEFFSSGIYLSGIADGVVRNCMAIGGRFVGSYSSNIFIDRCTAECDNTYYCVEAGNGDAVRINESVISGGDGNIVSIYALSNVEVVRSVVRFPVSWANFNISDRASMIVRDCDIQGTQGVSLVRTYGYPEGNTATIDLGYNYWYENSNSAALDSLIYDGNDDPNIHVIVNYEPIRTESVPVKKKSLGDLKALFLGR
jgi:hypothetical protein